MGREYTSKPRDVSFTLDGVTFTPAAMSLLDFADLARYADLDVDSPEGLAQLGQFFTDVLGEDYDRFRAHCAAHRTDGATLLEVISDILTDVAGFPTRRPSDSSDGPTNTAPTLRVISSTGGFREEQLTAEREAELRAAVEAATG